MASPGLYTGFPLPTMRRPPRSRNPPNGVTLDLDRATVLDVDQSGRPVSAAGGNAQRQLGNARHPAPEPVPGVQGAHARGGPGKDQVPRPQLE